MRLAKLVVLIGWLQLSTPVAGEALLAADPNKIKAAFLRNFAHYVMWPDGAFASADAPWHVCVVGPDPFGSVLDDTLSGRTEQGRAFQVFRAATLERLPSCQILYIALDDPSERQAALAALKRRPVLSVSDADGFLEEGGMIQFQVGERVEMSVNLDQAKAAALRIQTKMLEVSRRVLENGMLRTPR